MKLDDIFLCVVLIAYLESKKLHVEVIHLQHVLPLTFHPSYAHSQLSVSVSLIINRYSANQIILITNGGWVDLKSSVTFRK